MAQPSSRAELIDYCKRQLGAPVLEINVADEQISDLVDDAVQMFQERHYDGVVQMPLKYKVTQADIDRGRTRGNNKAVGIVTTTATSTIVGTAVTFSYEENSNYIQLPDSVIGVNKIYRFDGSNTITNNMFSVKYQMFLNDVYYFDSIELLSYAMVKTKLEDIDFLINTEKQIRFNIRQNRLYMDVDFASLTENDYLIIDCWRILNPNDFTRVYNDRFLKRYLTALIKRQWGQNLIKFQGVKLPGGIELNGRQIYDDAQVELDKIQTEMMSSYEIPPLDMIG
tara:strand:+ start:357 stop:1202 length:846 start_codon:yes stop_codon:yes gene_type:complete